MSKKQDDEKRRKERNQELLERKNNPNDNLTDQIPMRTRWFPPREIIKKDKKDIAKIFGEEKESG